MSACCFSDGHDNRDPPGRAAERIAGSPPMGAVGSRAGSVTTAVLPEGVSTTVCAHDVVASIVPRTAALPHISAILKVSLNIMVAIMAIPVSP